MHPDVRIGHIHLKVSDLGRSVAFYSQVLGFDVVQQVGDEAAFLSAGGYHHHIGLNTWTSQGGRRPPPDATGLYHFAILYPNRQELAKAVKRISSHHYPILGASDHGVSEAIYLADPDDNGIELYRDRPREQWPRQDGQVAMTTLPLDLDELLADAEA